MAFTAGPDDKSAHLRSANELIGYAISETDDDIGSLADLLIDPERWTVSFLAVDSGDWLPGKLVVIAPAWASEISWHARQISIPMTKEKIRNNPSPSALSDLQRSYENDFYACFGYPIM